VKRRCCDPKITGRPVPSASPSRRPTSGPSSTRELQWRPSTAKVASTEVCVYKVDACQGASHDRMVAHFTVYLPPFVLSPLPLDPKSKGDLSVRLHQLPASSHNWSQSLDPRRHNLLLSTQGSSRAGYSIRPIARDYGGVQGDYLGSMEAGGDPKGKRKVSQGMESTQDSTVSTRARKKVQHGTSLKNGHTQLDGSIAQRRSRRLSRANGESSAVVLQLTPGQTRS
jgi:hypothetical protein